MDIVERLRIQEETGFVYLPSDWGFVSYGKAADEIERLREALNKMQRSRDRYRQAWEAEKTRSTILQKERGDESYQ